MATALGIANRALRILGEPTVSDFTSTSRGGDMSDLFVDAWNEVRDEEDWYFLRTRTVLSDHAEAWTSDVEYAVGDGARQSNVIYNCILTASNIQPGVHASSSSYWESQVQDVYASYTGFYYRYDLPTDLGRVLWMQPANYDYIQEGDWLYTDYTPDTTNLYPRIAYLVDVLTSSATGPAISSTWQDRIPSWFERVVAARLAMDAAITISDDDRVYARAERSYMISLLRAREHNGHIDPGPDLEAQGWADVPSSGSWNVPSKEPNP